MKIFVAGATGVLGRRVLPLLVAAGHEVTAVARGREKARLVGSWGATPVSVDLFDPQAVKDAVAGHDVVCNLATKIPPMAKAALPGVWDENDRIRSEASRNLVDAALAAGAQRYIQESIAFTYPDRGDAWVDETLPIEPSPYAASTSEAEAQAERFTAGGGAGVVLRFGFFYGAGSAHTDAFLGMARRGISPYVGSGSAHLAPIHLDDAATAVVAALRAPAGAYNVVDDDPATRAEHASRLATALGRRRLRSVPRGAVTLGSRGTAEMLMRSQRVSNRRFKEATGWAPRFPTTSEGWAQIVGEAGAPSRAGGWRRVVLALLAFTAIQLGVWASVAPRGWYDTFPGGGRHWVAVDGPYNEHLVRDFGGLNLALALVTVVALVANTSLLVRTAAGAWLFFSVPHFVYHARHLDVFSGSDAAANLLVLGLAAVAPLVLLLSPGPARAAAGRGGG